MGATSLCELDLTFEIAIVTLSLKICPGYSSETVRCRNLILDRNIGLGM